MKLKPEPSAHPDERLKYIHHYKSQHGTARTAFRFGQFPPIKLKGQPLVRDGAVVGGTPEFMAHYWQLRSAAEGGTFGTVAPTYLPGTVGDVIMQYLVCEIDTPQFKGFKALAPTSQVNYRRALDTIRERAGGDWMKDVTAHGLRGFRNKLTADGLATSQIDEVRTLWSVLWTFASEFLQPMPLELGKNPVGDILRTHGKSKHHKRWPLPVIQKVIEVNNDVMKLAITLLLYTGQREIDVIKMRWTDYQPRGNRWMIQVVQQKTGTKVWIPAHPKLMALLDVTPRINEYILNTTRLTPFTRTSSISGTIRNALKNAGFAGDGYSGHGLRTAAACELMECIGDIYMVASITGHKDLKVLQGYLAEVNQEKLALKAIDRWAEAD